MALRMTFAAVPQRYVGSYANNAANRSSTLCTAGFKVGSRACRQSRQLLMRSATRFRAGKVLRVSLTTVASKSIPMLSNAQCARLHLVGRIIFLQDRIGVVNT